MSDQIGFPCLGEKTFGNLVLIFGQKVIRVVKFQENPSNSSVRWEWNTEHIHNLLLIILSSLWLNSENFGKNIHASSGNLVLSTKGTVFFPCWPS